MSDVGRNDPCHCGSGKKYKHCHIRIDAEAPPPAENPGAVLHRRDEEIALKLYRFARDRFGERWISDSMKAYAGGSVRAAERETQLSVPWSLYIYETRGKTAASLYLEERGARLTPEEREMVQAQQSAHISLWAVDGADPGRGISIRDLLTGEARFVEEETGSRELDPGDVVLARVVDAAGLSIFSGLHPKALEGEPVETILRQVRARCDLPEGIVDKARLADRGVADALLEEWRGASG